MPEFILDHGSAEASRTFKRLDAFTQGYIEAMFFTDASSADDGDLEDATLADLAPATLAAVIKDCAEFQASEAERLADYYEARQEDHAGHDFWLTRNGHGAGFWDRGLGALGDRLADAARACGSRDLYRGDDGLIYLM